MGYSVDMTNHFVYIFDYRTAFGTYLPFRVPMFIAKLICHGSQYLDYAETEQGY